MGYFNINNDENNYYNKNSISNPNNLLNGRNWIIFICVAVGWWFFGSYETMSCDQNSCEIYKTRRLTKVSQPYKKFDESDIERFGYTNYNSEDKTTYTPYVVLKDGSRIKLNMLETSNVLEVKYLSFDNLRNKKFK